MTFARTSQVVTEVLRTNTNVNVRASQMSTEVLRINTGTVIRASQLVAEVLRPNDAEVGDDVLHRYVIVT
jgi:hypothetical protein